MSAAPPVVVWIGLGSNLGDRQALLDAAVAALRASAEVMVRRVSPWIETEPVGGPAGQPWFWNGVLEAQTSLPAEALLALLQAIEARLGRERSAEVPNGPRPIDLDLLFYGDEHIETPGLVVPHPRLEERVFVLHPLSLLAPERRLPRCGLTVRERLAALSP